MTKKRVGPKEVCWIFLQVELQHRFRIGCGRYWGLWSSENNFRALWSRTEKKHNINHKVVTMTSSSTVFSWNVTTSPNMHEICCVKHYDFTQHARHLLRAMSVCVEFNTSFLILLCLNAAVSASCSFLFSSTSNNICSVWHMQEQTRNPCPWRWVLPFSRYCALPGEFW